VGKIQVFFLNLTSLTGTLHEDICALTIICHGIHRRMRNVADESSRENQNTHFMSNDNN
jgi:hypothetical protein